jgi:hypothetical protein
VAGAFSFHVAIVVGANEAPVLCRLGEGWSKLPSPVNVVRSSSMESSIVAHCGVDARYELSLQKWCLRCPSWEIGSGRRSSRR